MVNGMSMVIVSSVTGVVLQVWYGCSMALVNLVTLEDHPMTRKW